MLTTASHSPLAPLSDQKHRCAIDFCGGCTKCIIDVEKSDRIVKIWRDLHQYCTIGKIWKKFGREKIVYSFINAYEEAIETWNSTTIRYASGSRNAHDLIMKVLLPV
jgi:hypothetical protein